MKNPFGIWSVLSCAVMLGAGLMALRSPLAPKSSGSVATRIVAISGEDLTTLFDGLAPVARYKWNRVSKETPHNTGSCGGPARASVLERFLIAVGVETVAYAQCTGCPRTNCGGQYECYDFTQCDPCYGSVVNPDFECGPPKQGEMEDGAGCIFCLCALCNRPLCTS